MSEFLRPRPEVSIILPTFNESANIVPLVKRLQAAITESDLNTEYIFVDDSSDNTPDIIIEQQKFFPNISLLKRKGDEAKTGLTRAFQAGFERARGEIIVCMDTDLQHPPEKIIDLVNTLKRGNRDLIIASRYTKGGSADGLSNKYRRIVSKIATWLVWVVLPGTRKTTDPMTGFFAFKASILNKVTFGSYGFKILVELLVRAEGLSVQDIPFTFMTRENEESKASASQGVRFISDILTIFIKTPFGNPFLKHGLSILLLSALAGTFYYLQTFLNIFGERFFVFEGIFFVMVTAVIVAIASFSWLFILREKHKTRSLYLPVFWSLSVTFSIFWFQQHFFQEGILSYLATIFLGGLLSFLLVRPFLLKEFEFVPSYWLKLLGVFSTLAVVTDFVSIRDTGYFLLVLGYSFIIIQGIFALYLMIFSWLGDRGVGKVVHASPKQYLAPKFSFTAIIPCKHERYAIADTLKTLSSMSYPEDMFEVIVVIHEGTDDGTIGVVRDAITAIDKPNLRLVTYNISPVNKPHGLNHALKESKGDVIVIFDAEDEPHKELFHIVNTEMIQRDLDVVQSGVQLMNYDHRWYSLFNVLEYYFWFKSSLHYFANQGVTTLGGVTVFFKKSWLNHVGGWDNSCLTEDADVGIRLSQAGARVGVVYDAEHATQEETPPSLWSFVKQRTRWAQGFLQIISRGVWLRFPTLQQKLLALYVLGWPFTLLVLFMMLPFGLITMFMVNLPPTVAVLSNIPLILFLIFVVVQLLGLYEFTKEYEKPFPWLRIPLIIVSFYPYTVLLAFAGLRAMYRNLKNNTSWEKTEHLNNHRAEGVNSVDVLTGETRAAQ